jgi:hypothetical protein
VTKESLLGNPNSGACSCSKGTWLWHCAKTMERGSRTRPRGGFSGEGEVESRACPRDAVSISIRKRQPAGRFQID